jgi:hypothetical protein
LVDQLLVVLIVDIVRFIHLGASQLQHKDTQLKPLHDAIHKLGFGVLAEEHIIKHRKFNRTPCRSINDFHLLAQDIDEGTFGSVSIATDPTDGATVALKRLKHLQSSSGIPYWSMRELMFLRRLNHKNIVKSRQVAVDLALPDTSKSTFVIVMDFSPADVCLISGLLSLRSTTRRLANVKVCHLHARSTHDPRTIHVIHRYQVVGYCDVLTQACSTLFANCSRVFITCTALV